MWRRWLKETHWPLVFSALGLVAVGTLFIFSASFHDSGHYMGKHLFWLGAAFLILFLAPFLGYRAFLNISYLLYTISVALLIAVLVIGEARLGARRWLQIGPLLLQPSEFAKLATLLALANFLGTHHPWEKNWKIVLSAAGLILLPLFLIAKQPDLGSALMFVPMLVVLLFLWGLRMRFFLLAGFSAGLAAPFFWGLLKEYQKKRILVFLNPNLDPLGSGYTAIQSKIAVGSGGLLGKGYLAGTQSQLQFVPEHHTDFIFCVIGEEWGYAGTLLVLLLYGFLFHAVFQVISHTTDPKAKLLAAGILATVFTQVLVNIGMSFGLMPITGITLPLISYGGSSLVATTIALGLLLSIYKGRSIF